MSDQHEMETELSYPARKARERGRAFWAQAGDHALMTAVIVAIIAGVAWAMGKL